MNDNELRLYSLSVAAKRLGIGKTNLAKLIECGKIGTIELFGRYKISHLELIKFIDENTRRQNNKESDIDVETFFEGKNNSDEKKEIITNKYFNDLKKEAA